MKASKKTHNEFSPGIQVVKSIGVPTNPFFEKKRLDAIRFIQKNPLPERFLKQISQD
ncbi:hypothetical protein [Dyadobacter sp. OTU695]|uniref:hypothetical protein n=1 Tax=Dyadobacter sp. OTU695 TaxID=3043860 RepID=UPI00313D6075